MAANKPPARRILGIRGTIPTGYLLGRVSPGEGDVELISPATAKGAGLIIPTGLSPISDGDVLANISGSVAAPIANTVSDLLDHVMGNARGNVLYRGASGWVVLAPGSSGNFLKTQGAGADPIWSILSPSSMSLTNSHVFVGNSSNVAADVAMSGDVTISNTGATTIKSSVALAGSPTTTTQSQNDNSTKISTTAYVDLAVANGIAGVNPAVTVEAATTSASNTSGLTYNNGASGIGATFTGAVNTALTVDGYTFTALGQRLLVKNDTQSPSGAFNGVYYVTQLQTALLPLILTRALDYDQPSNINDTGAIPVINGTVNATTSWLLTSKVTTVGTSPLTYVQFSFAPVSAANPTATASDVAVNGSATSYMRSDAAPAVQKCSSSVFGLIKVDGTTLTASGGVGSAAFPLAFIAGLVTSNNAGTPNTKIDIASGKCRSDDDTQNIISAGVLTADCTTTGANGLQSGSLANNTWYYVWIIAKADNTTASFVSTSLSPTLPSGYTVKRLVGFAKTDGSAHFITYSQNGNEWLWKAPLEDYNATPGVTTAVSIALTVPSNLKVNALCMVQGDYAATAAYIYVSSVDQPDVAAGSTNYNAFVNSNNFYFFSQFNLRTDASGNIRVRCTATDVTFVVFTRGWVWDRANLPY